jgi:hypothetical protein
LDVEASEKAKRASEGLAVTGSIVDRSSERPKRGYNEVGACLSLGRQRPIEGDGLAMERKRTEGRIEDLGTGQNEMQRNLEQFSDF